MIDLQHADRGLHKGDPRYIIDRHCLFKEYDQQRISYTIAIAKQYHAAGAEIPRISPQELGAATLTKLKENSPGQLEP